MINPTRIDQQNNHKRIKEILSYYNWLDATVSKLTREVKEKKIDWLRKLPIP